MALSRDTVIDKVEVTENGTIQVRRATYIVEEGQRIAGPEYARVTYSPGANISGEPAKIQQVAAIWWTPEVIAAYQAVVASVPARLIG